MAGYPIALAVVVGVAGCFIKPGSPGEVAPDDGDVGDAMADGDLGCTWGPWGQARELVGLNTSASEFGATLTRDELLIVWERSNMLWESKRSSLSGSWSTPKAVTLVGFGGGPLINDDGRQIWYHRYNPAPAYADIMQSTRGSLDDPWSIGQPYDPFAKDGYERDFEMSWNGLDAVLFVGEDDVNDEEDIAIAHRDSPGELFGTWTRLPVASRSGTYDCCPGISPDGLEVLWETDALWMSKRATRSDPFVGVDEVPGLDDPDYEYGDPHFNAAGNRLYFARTIRDAANYDLYVVERACADAP